jgi:hypothetical protein
MHPLIAFDVAKIRMTDMKTEAERARLVGRARPARKQTNSEPIVPGRWALRRLFAKLHLAGSGA